MLVASLRSIVKGLYQRLIFGVTIIQYRKLKKRLIAYTQINDLWTFSKNVFETTQVEDEICEFIKYSINFSPKIICEIGVERGGTSFLFSTCLPTIEKVIGIDLVLKNVPLLKFLSRSKNYYLEGYSSSEKVFNKVRKILSGKQIDLLFIDGDHSYKGVKADFEKFLPLVGENGVIAFHDICEDHNSRFGKNTSNFSGGVPQFWKEIKDHYPKSTEFVHDRNQDGFGIGLIHKTKLNATP
ncbi:MAG: class I SAM-dependent methyltransferase [Opitutales bacterium]|nr:class I SAM-dependent methyltransferase [Opitutales bacterium]